MIFSSFAEAFRQLPEPEFRMVLIKSVAMALLVFVALLTVAMYFLSDFAYFDWEWLNTLAQVAGGLGFLLVELILFPALSGIIVCLFLDDIAAAVESKHYPNDPPGQSLAIKGALSLALRFFGVILLLNILALPLYIILFFIPPMNLVLFYCLNGYLLSREYFELVGSRHLDVKNLRTARKRNSFAIFPIGILIAFMLTIPILNLLAPIVATAAMVHVFKNLRDQGKIEVANGYN